MAITKTKFIQYRRCPRYIALEDLKKDTLLSYMDYSSYLEDEKDEELQELLSTMVDETGQDLLNVLDEQLEVMLPYYREVEVLAGKLCPYYFDGMFRFARNTEEQESFDFKRNGIRYICYVDIYNETDDSFRIIEVKATTDKKFLKLGGLDCNKNFVSIFSKRNGIYYLREDLEDSICSMSEHTYYQQRKKLLDSYGDVGHYVYDLAVQRYIIENDLKQHSMGHLVPTIRYFLAVLNSSYIYDGFMEDGKRVYRRDCNGEDIISFFDMTTITKEYMKMVDQNRISIENYLAKLDKNPYPVGPYCQYKQKNGCKFHPVCFHQLPSENSLFSFVDHHHGFKNQKGEKFTIYDLLNRGIYKIQDMPLELLTRPKNSIQYHCVLNQESYQDYLKIQDGIRQLQYPIYHLDFETFPCPLPRYEKEKCYTQSVFQFSLHIERKEGVCDKQRDHYGYLAKDSGDHRQELIEEMLKYISVDQPGTIMVYNASFERTRLKELGEAFPMYQKSLEKMRMMIFDLMDILKSNGKFYQNLGYEKKRATMWNYYHAAMNGSFSIKKVLPLFSNLTYKNMEIGNGTEALVTYAKFSDYKQDEFIHKYEKLVEYCKQDTWAMVEILHGLRNMCKS